MKNRNSIVYVKLAIICLLNLFILNGCSSLSTGINPSVNQCPNPSNSSCPIDNVKSVCKKLVLFQGQSDISNNTPVAPYQRPQILSALNSHTARNTRQLNETGIDSSLVLTFDWRGTGFGTITGATLKFFAHPESAQDYNDNIQIYPYITTQGSYSLAGANLGTNGNDPGIKLSKWNNIFFPNGDTFVIDLKNFPSHLFKKTHGGPITVPNPPPYKQVVGVSLFDASLPPAGTGGYQYQGGYDITRSMNKLGFIDFFIGDETNVKYVELTLISCLCNQ